MENVDVILNLVIALLLVITIIFCLNLSRKISAFNSNKTDLAKFLLEFNDSIKKAEGNINLLKEMGSNVDENLKSQIKRARFLANDLSFLAEKGENVAQNLETKLSISRDVSKKIATENSVSTPPRDVSISEETSRPRTNTEINPKKSKMSPSKRQALDALLQEIAKRKGSA